MKPQSNEPCVHCAIWNDKTGCEYYNSSAMVIFGACGHKQPKENGKERCSNINS